MKLKISDDLSLPIEAVTQTFAILAKRGVGKTHTASVMAEEMLKVGQPIVVYDPTGAWYGLKSSKNGKHAGFPVVVFGGEHADVPLEETAGNTIASVIVERRFPAILDCSLLRKGARIRFMTDFCETLYHKNRDALHFFVDEAQTIAPQNLKAMPEAARLLGAMEDIVLQGRRRGLGLTIISPRPAVVNTNLRSACEVIIAMQTIAPHDRDAISEWIDLHGDDADRAKKMMDSLSSLRRGQAWVWSPSWLNLFKQITFRDRETFDSSATPEVGHKAVVPKKMAAIDLASLGEQIKATVDKAKADDPRELRKKIAELERQLKQRPTETTDRVVEKIVEVPVLRNGQLEKTTKAVDRMEAVAQKLLNDAAETRRLIAPAFAPKPAPKPVAAPQRAQPMQRQTPRHDPAPAGAQVGEIELTRVHQKILNEIASLESIGVLAPDRVQVGLFCGYTNPRSGGFSEPVGDLIKAGLVVSPQPGLLSLSDEGRKIAQADQTSATTEELQERILAKFDGPRAKILRELIAIYPNDVDRMELGHTLGYTNPRSGGFSEPLGSLKSLGVVDYTSRGRVRASDMLFLISSNG